MRSSRAHISMCFTVTESSASTNEGRAEGRVNTEASSIQCAVGSDGCNNLQSTTTTTSILLSYLFPEHAGAPAAREAIHVRSPRTKPRDTFFINATAV